jgi:hypothetical protein
MSGCIAKLYHHHTIRHPIRDCNGSHLSTVSSHGSLATLSLWDGFKGVFAVFLSCTFLEPALPPFGQLRTVREYTTRTQPGTERVSADVTLRGYRLPHVAHPRELRCDALLWFRLRVWKRKKLNKRGGDNQRSPGGRCIPSRHLSIHTHSSLPSRQHIQTN